MSLPRSESVSSLSSSSTSRSSLITIGLSTQSNNPPLFDHHPRHHYRSQSRYLSPSEEPLLTYPEFLTSLYYPEPETLALGSECPICHELYTTATHEIDPVHLYPFRSLPFDVQHDSRNDINIIHDRPGRLPCAGGHIVGNACIRTWFTDGGSNTCPFDRQPLFHHSHYGRTQRSCPERYSAGRRRIETMSLRELIQQSRSYTTEDRVNVSSRTMTQRLATLLFRVAFRFDQNGADSPRTGTSYAVAPPRWPRLMSHLQYGEEVSRFTHLVRRSIENVPLTSTGQYLSSIMLLLNPALPHLFTLLYRLAHVYQGHTLPASELTTILQSRINDFFRDYPEHIDEVHEMQLRTFITTTVDIWVAQELLMTNLRAITQTPNPTTYSTTLSAFLVGYPRRLSSALTYSGSDALAQILQERVLESPLPRPILLSLPETETTVTTYQDALLENNEVDQESPTTVPVNVAEFNLYDYRIPHSRHDSATEWLRPLQNGQDSTDMADSSEERHRAPRGRQERRVWARFCQVLRPRFGGRRQER